MIGGTCEPDDVHCIDAEIQRIERSVRCFQFALAGCIPVLGLPWAYASLREFRRVKRIGLDGWNAGARFLLAGKVIGWIAFIFNVALWTLLLVLFLNELL